jgi:choline dehydrogenase-like flavoprotein
MTITGDHDYIVVGSGAAGSVLAERLSAGGAATVLVLEAGGSDRHPRLLVPGLFTAASSDDRWATTDPTVVAAAADPDPWVRGRVVGGSTTVNGMMWNRGERAEYEAMAAPDNLGATGWGWARFHDAYREIEDHDLGADPSRGAGGPLPIGIAGPPDPVSDSLLATCGRHGIVPVADINAAAGQRIGYTPRNVRHGRRVSAATAFLRRAARRPNVEVRTRTKVRCVVFDGTRAIGVAAVHDGTELLLRARREVILCAGAVHSPLLLERSGVGQPAVLAAAGIATVAESPRVGENLRQHRGLVVSTRLRDGMGFNPVLASRAGQVRTWARYLVAGDGVLSYGGGSLIGVLRADPGSGHPDTQVFFAPYSPGVTDPAPRAVLAFYPAFPRSTGSVHLAPDGSPRIAPGYFTDDHDVTTMFHAVRRVRALLESEPFASIRHPVDGGLVGLPTADDAAMIADHARDHGMTGYHAVGACAMGTGDDDVLDTDLRVRGTQNLRVVDASCFPALTSGNNAAPTMALAWIAGGRLGHLPRSGQPRGQLP